MSMTEQRTKQYIILNVVRGGYVTSPLVNRSVFADIAIGNGGHGVSEFDALHVFCYNVHGS